MDKNEIPKTERDFNTFFTKERQKTLSFLRGRYKLSGADAEDIYQDSCLALFKNIKMGKLVSLTSTLSTYFTQVCIFQALKKIRDTKFTDSIDNGKYDPEKVNELLGIGSEFTVEQQQAMEDIVSHMPPPCDLILWSFYYDHKNMSEIADIIDFKNADSVKAKKSQCMSKLKSTYTNKITEIIYGED